MKLGLSSPLEHRTPHEWATKMKQLGCGSVVFPVNCLADKSLIDEYAFCAKENGLIIAEVGIWNNVLCSDKVKREEAIEYAINQLKMADYINAVCCVNIAGTPVGTRWDGAYKENFCDETWKSIVQTTQQIIDSAKPKHTFYCIESMPWMYPSSPDEYIRLINDVNRPQFKAHLDIVNMINTPQRYFFNKEFISECFTKLKGNICSCHLKDIKLKPEYTFQLEETRCGNGTLDIEAFVEYANKENPQMPMIIEHLNTDNEYIESLSYIKNRLGI